MTCRTAAPRPPNSRQFSTRVQRPSWVVIRTQRTRTGVSACARGRRQKRFGRAPCRTRFRRHRRRQRCPMSTRRSLHSTRARSRGSRAALSCKMRESGASRTRTRARAQNMPAFSVTRRLAYRRRTTSALSTSCACERRCRQARSETRSLACDTRLLEARGSVCATWRGPSPREGMYPGGPAARLPTGAAPGTPRARDARM